MKSRPRTLTAIMRSHSSTSAPTTGPSEHHAGVVDEDVQPSEPVDGLLDGRLGLVRSVMSASHDEGRAAGRLDLGGECLEAVASSGHECDGGAVLGEPAGGRRADAAARPGDEGDGVVQC